MILLGTAGGPLNGDALLILGHLWQGEVGGGMGTPWAGGCLSLRSPTQICASLCAHFVFDEQSWTRWVWGPGGLGDHFGGGEVGVPPGLGGGAWLVGRDHAGSPSIHRLLSPALPGHS